MKRLSEWLAEAGVESSAVSKDPAVSGIASDSRSVQPGDLFVCMPSESRDTYEFIPQAVSRGAAAVLGHSAGGAERAERSGVPFIQVPDFADAVWRLAKVLSGNPSGPMRVVGVTGTNGKTTTAWLIRDALASLGRKAAYIGTLGLQTPSGERELSNTTPFPVELQSLISESRRDGAEDLVMEVSSHALQERRADGVEFDVGVFTNLTQDHLDFHGTMEEYAAAKLRLFTDLPGQSAKRFVAALNVDDPIGLAWSSQLSVPVLTYGVAEGALRGEPLDVRVDGIGMALSYSGSREVMESRLGGRYNVENLLSAAAGLIALGYSTENVARGLKKARPVPGRFEPVPNELGIHILVDYAHTPDALAKLLDAVKESATGRIITVFGCGGDRDRTKRPLMAAAASSRSDQTVVTSDNPRTENPESIVSEVASGIVTGASSKTIVDRREAVAYAISQARPGDVVVIAGKGHENYQIIGKTKFPMDDRELAREAMGALR